MVRVVQYRMVVPVRMPVHTSGGNEALRMRRNLTGEVVVHVTLVGHHTVVSHPTAHVRAVDRKTGIIKYERYFQSINIASI